MSRWDNGGEGTSRGGRRGEKKPPVAGGDKQAKAKDGSGGGRRGEEKKVAEGDKQAKDGSGGGGTVQQKVPDRIRRSLAVLSDYVRRKDREPLIGLEYILEYKVQVRPDKLETKYFCEICEMDSGVVPIVDHLCGYKHRKLYVAKEYPYVLRAVYAAREEVKVQFMRKMAVEIEQAEGTKDYKRDPVIRRVAVMNVKSTEAKQSKRRTRWDPEGERQLMMTKVLRHLESFSIADNAEALVVARLVDRVEYEAKFHLNKYKEEALFPARVARAKTVAITIMHEALRTQIARREARRNDVSHLGPPNVGPWAPQRSQGLNQPIQGQGAAPQTEPLDEEDEDITFFKKLFVLLDLLPDSMTPDDGDSDFLVLKSLLDKVADLENDPEDEFITCYPPAAPLVEEVPRNLGRMAQPAPYAPGAGMPRGREDIAQSRRSLMSQPAPYAPGVPRGRDDNTQSQRSLMSQPAPYAPGVPRGWEDNVQSQRSLMSQPAPYAPGVPRGREDNAQSQRSLMSQPAPYAPGVPRGREDDAQSQRSLMRIAEFLHGSQVNADTTDVPNYALRGGDPMDRHEDRGPPLAQDSRYADMSRRDEDLRYDRPLEEKYGSTSTESTTYMSHVPTRDLYPEMRHDAGGYMRDRGDSSYSSTSPPGGSEEHGDCRVRQPPFPRAGASPGRLDSDTFQESRYDWDFRRETPGPGSHDPRPAHTIHRDPACAGGDTDLRYGKRPRVDSDHMTILGTYHPGHRDFQDIDTTNLPPDLRKRIQGRDLFTMQAMLDEYADFPK